MRGCFFVLFRFPFRLSFIHSNFVKNDDVADPDTATLHSLSKPESASELSRLLDRAVANRVQYGLYGQYALGILSAGPVASISYVVEKMKKFANVSCNNSATQQTQK